MKTVRCFVVALLIMTGISCTACREVASPLEDYTWVLTSYGKLGEVHDVLPETEVTAFFDSETNEVSGNGGCNHYGGGYEVDGLDLIMKGSFYATEMWCGDAIGEQERMYLEALQAAESFRLENGNLRIDCGEWLLNFERQ